MFSKEKIQKVLREYPGLTGKQIAKELGVDDKSSFNKFLYANSEGLRQEGWKWYLADDYVLELGAQFTWIGENNFEESLTASGCLLSSSASKCVIRFPEDCKILLVAGV